MRVSTVFLGIDHNFSGNGDPVLYETMVFGGTLDGEQDRHETYAMARYEHAQMVDRVERAIAAATIPEGELCERCKKVPGDAEHECPFASEIRDNHDLCNCCSACCYECAMDI